MAERAAGATDVPAVLALGGPRPAEAEALFAEQDLVIVVAASDAESLASLALDRLPAGSPPAVVVRPFSGGARR
ncbi:hypothetical protein RCF19_34620, partial [Rhodococcus qingshengii]